MLSVGFGLIALGICLGSFSISTGYFHLPISWTMVSFIGLLSCAVYAVRVRLAAEQKNLEGIFIGLALLLTLFFASDIPLRRHDFVQVSHSHLVFLLCAFLAVVSIRFGFERIFVFMLGIASIAIPVTGFIGASGGALLWSDDHPPFLYRLLLLRDHFPSVPIYSPQWNGGYDAREFLPSGSLGPFLLGLPLVYFTDLLSTYNYLVVYLMFGITSLSAWWSARLLGVHSIGASVASVLSVTSSFFWYRWGLSYGTLGFLTSAALAPLVLALWSRLLTAHAESPRQSLLLITVIATSLMMLWSPAVFLLAPLGILGVLRWKTIETKRAIIGATIAISLVSAPWMGTFVVSSQVGSFLSSGKGKPIHGTDRSSGSQKVSAIKSLDAALSTVRQFGSAAHPLIILGGIVALARFWRKSSAAGFCIGIVSSVIIGSVIGPYVPKLELERFLLITGILLSVPLGWLLGEGLQAASRRSLSLFTVSTGLVLGAVVLGVAQSWTIVRSKGDDRIYFAGPIVSQVSDAIRAYGGNGRVMVAGFILHELNQGHIALLPTFSGIPMIASSYQHDRWEYSDVVPQHFRTRELRGVLEYLNLMNVSAILTHDKFWHDWYSKRSKHFTRVWSAGRFALFVRTKFPDSYVFEGDGEVMSIGDRQVTIQMNGPSLTLRFSYMPFLRASGCTVVPFDAGGGVQLVRIESCLSKGEVILDSIPHVQRVFHRE